MLRMLYNLRQRRYDHGANPLSHHLRDRGRRALARRHSVAPVVVIMGRCIAYHGIAAYSGANGRAVPAYLHGIAAAGCDGEICVSDRPIGPIGLIVEGPIIVAFDDDVWSTVRDDGTRRQDDRRWWSGIEAPTHAQWVQFTLEKRRGQYCEGFMRAPEVRGVWSKPAASKLERAAADALARRFCLRVRVLHPTVRIQDEYPA